MACIKCFGVHGIKMWITSGDHEPPHFHARRSGEWSICVYFLEPGNTMIRSIKPSNARIKRNDRKKIVDGVEKHRSELLAEWEACHE